MNEPPKQETETPPGAPAPGETAEGKLDLSGLEPPADLSESSIEEVTIDGICGVY